MAGVFGHFGSYVIIMSMLSMIYLFTDSGEGDFWVKWPALGWGAGLALYFLSLLLGQGKAEAEQQVQHQEDELEQARDEPTSQAEPVTRKRQEKMRPRPVEYSSDQ